MGKFLLTVILIILNLFFIAITSWIASFIKDSEMNTFLKGLIGSFIGLGVELGRFFAAAGILSGTSEFGWRIEMDTNYLEWLANFRFVNIPILVGIGFTVASTARTKSLQACPNCKKDFDYDPLKIEGFIVPEKGVWPVGIGKEFKLTCPFCKALITVESEGNKVVSFESVGGDEAMGEDLNNHQIMTITENVNQSNNLKNIEEGGRKRKDQIFESRLGKRFQPLIGKILSEKNKGFITDEDYLKKENEIVENCRSELMQQDSNISYEVYMKLAATKQATVERLLETINNNEMIVLHHNKVKLITKETWNNYIAEGISGSFEIIFISN
jgi:hypothetical protein